MSEEGSGVHRGLSFAGAGAILNSIGKILALVANGLIIAAILYIMVNWGGEPAMIYFTPLLFAILVFVLMIMAIIGKPEAFVKYFMFICTDLGVLIVILALSFQSFPWVSGSASEYIGYFPFWASIIGWFVCVYLLIVSILHCAKVV